MDISTKLVHFYGLSINAILSLRHSVSISITISAPVSPIRSVKVWQAGSYFHPNDHIRGADLVGPPETKGIALVSEECLFICFFVGCGSQRVLWGGYKNKIKSKNPAISEAIDRPIKPPRH